MHCGSRYYLLLLVFIGVGLFYSFGLQHVYKFLSVVYACISEFRLSISRNADEVKIYIWTSREKTDYQVVRIGEEEQLRMAGFNSEYPVKILIHGFSDKGITSWTDRLHKEYYSVGIYNVFTVDWQSLAESPWYNTASKNTKIVGDITAKFVSWLVSDMGVVWDNVHVLGSSLGAQAAGYTGSFTGGKIGRITGLDPSGPLFHSVGTVDKLDMTDGQFVDVIHTAGYWVGNEDVMGHVDFFPNGGRAPQPGCEKKESLDLSCSHFQAWILYAESIRTKHNPSLTPLVGLRCNSYQMFLDGSCCRVDQKTAIMGEGVDLATRGTFYLKTRRKSRFALPSKNSTNCELVTSEPSEVNWLVVHSDGMQ